jgi:hypothetical protein
MNKKMSKNFLVLFGPAIGLAALTITSLANAHHGFAAHFDPDNPIRVAGIVKQFNLVNPHSSLQVESIDESGETVVYTCDLQARSQMVRHGFTDDLFTVGEDIVIEGFQGRRDPYYCELGVAHFADGSSFTIRTMDGARTQFAPNLEIPVEANVDRTIFGNWIRPGMYGDKSGRKPNGGRDSITPAGQMASDAFDPVADNPVAHCRGGSPVRNWGAAGLATEIYEENGDIFVHHESMDVVRQIHMTMSEHPADTPLTEMGHSIGQFEDGYLVIDTTHFAAGTITGGELHTDQMTMQEKVWVNEDSGRLQISWVIDEPIYYSEPLTGGQELHSTNQEILTYDCTPRLSDYH